MVTDPTVPRPKLVYTPKNHIPIGEPIIWPDGTQAVRFKKAKENITEEIPVLQLIEMLIQATNR